MTLEKQVLFCFVLFCFLFCFCFCLFVCYFFVLFCFCFCLFLFFVFCSLFFVLIHHLDNMKTTHMLCYAFKDVILLLFYSNFLVFHSIFAIYHSVQLSEHSSFILGFILLPSVNEKL